MPMLDIQRRWAESFRLRLGEKALSRSGKEIPRALDGHLRITSQSRATIDAIARVYGGVTSDWEGQHQLIFPGDSMSIVVLPGDACVGWWEQWRKKDGGMPVCTHRCDGQINHQVGGPCSCPPVSDRLADREHYCQPATRLWFMLPDVEVIGAGRLETHGIIAAETFPQSVMVLQSALRRGEMVPAVLRVVKVESSGRNFIVPRIEVTGVSLDQLLSGSVGTFSHGLPAGSDSLSPPAGVESLRKGACQTPPSSGPTADQLTAIRKKYRAADDAICQALHSVINRPVDSLKSLTPGEVDVVLS